MKNLFFYFILLAGLLPAMQISVEQDGSKLQVDDITAKFSCFGTAGDKTNEILYSRFPFNSYATLCINGYGYIFGPNFRDLKFKKSPKRIITTGMAGNIMLEQDISLDENPGDKKNNIITFRYKISNKGKDAKTGLRILMVLGLDAGTRFRMGDNVSINDETEFSKTAMESAWSCLDKSGKIIFQGILEADKITKPDKIVFSAMRNPYFAAWDYNNQVKKGKALPDKPEQTSIGIYFDEKPLAAGASIEYVSSLFLSDSPLSIPEDKIIENKDLLIMEYLQKMQSSFSSGDYQEAINNIEYILALNSGHFEAQDYLTRCAEKMAEKKQDEISAEADRPAELFKKISELFKAAKYQEALDLLENFYGTYGREDLEPLQEMIKFKLRQQKLKKITSENPEYDQYTNFKKQAESAYSQQQYVPGLKALLGILKISPYDETALKYLTSYIGKIKAQNELLLSLANLLYKGGVDKAESDPLLAHGYFRILRLALPGFNKDEIAKRFNETMPEYDKPLDADKKNNAMSLIKEAAMLADDSRDYSGAVQKLKSAAALVPQEINLWERMIKNRALAAAYSGFDKTGFISDIKNSVKKNTGVKDSILKADAYLAKKLPAQAKEFYNKALILDPQNSHAEQQLKKIK